MSVVNGLGNGGLDAAPQAPGTKAAHSVGETSTPERDRTSVSSLGGGQLDGDSRGLDLRAMMLLMMMHLLVHLVVLVILRFLVMGLIVLNLR